MLKGLPLNGGRYMKAPGYDPSGAWICDYNTYGHFNTVPFICQRQCRAALEYPIGNKDDKGKRIIPLTIFKDLALQMKAIV